LFLRGWLIKHNRYNVLCEKLWAQYNLEEPSSRPAHDEIMRCIVSTAGNQIEKQVIADFRAKKQLGTEPMKWDKLIPLLFPPPAMIQST
jgi:hypothetical protein